MKALRFYAPEDVRLEDVPEPTCAPDEVKMRVRNCSTCGTDVKIFYNGHQNLTPPRTIGHEIAGEIVEVGADVNAIYGSNWQEGDRVQVIAAVPCGECHECRNRKRTPPTTEHAVRQPRSGSVENPPWLSSPTRGPIHITTPREAGGL